jgi:DNA primase
MEGYTDVIMAFQHGISNAVACCGTALGESQIQLLKRYCDSVVLLLDGDEAGQRRTSEILELFVSAQMDLRILTLPEELDPCDFLIEHGGSRLQEMIVGAVDALEHKIRSVCRGFDPLLDTHRATSALESILQSLSRVSHRSLLTGDSARIRQDQIIARLSRQFGIEQSEIRIRLDSIRKQASQREQFRREAAQRAQPANAAQVNLDKADPTRIVAKPAIDYRYSELSAVECELFEILALHPELVSMAIERFPITSLGTDTARGLFQLYMDLELGGHSLDFSSVMSATEQPQIKSVLVSVEEHASRKLEKSTMTADERLHSLCARLSNQEDAAYHRSQIRSLEQKQLDEQSELDVLQQIVQQAKVRHGIVPTNR